MRLEKELLGRLNCIAFKWKKKWHLKAKMLKTSPLKLEITQRSGWGMGSVRYSRILTAIWAPGWCFTGQLIVQINKQLKFFSKGITEMNAQEHRESTKGQESWFWFSQVNPALWLLAEHEVGIIIAVTLRGDGQLSPLSSLPTGASESGLLCREKGGGRTTLFEVPFVGGCGEVLGGLV